MRSPFTLDLTYEITGDADTGDGIPRAAEPGKPDSFTATIFLFGVDICSATGSTVSEATQAVEKKFTDGLKEVFS